MKILLAAACAALLATPALALKPATDQFLTELGFTPQAAEITAIAKDVINNKSLDTLAAKRDETGIRAFIATRNFIREFRKNPEAEFPEAELYNIAFLTAADKTYISTKLAEAFPTMRSTKPA